MTEQNVVVIKNLNFRYDTGAPLNINGLDCVIPANSKVILVGANGAGKSTLLRILTGVIYLGLESDEFRHRGHGHAARSGHGRRYLGGVWKRRRTGFEGIEPYSMDIAARDMMKKWQDENLERRDELVRVLGINSTRRLAGMHECSDGQSKKVRIMLKLLCVGDRAELQVAATLHRSSTSSRRTSTSSRELGSSSTSRRSASCAARPWSTRPTSSTRRTSGRRTSRSCSSTKNCLPSTASTITRPIKKSSRGRAKTAPIAPCMCWFSRNALVLERQYRATPTSSTRTTSASRTSSWPNRLARRPRTATFPRVRRLRERAASRAPWPLSPWTSTGANGARRRRRARSGEGVRVMRLVPCSPRRPRRPRAHGRLARRPPRRLPRDSPPAPPRRAPPLHRRPRCTAPTATAAAAPHVRHGQDQREAKNQRDPRQHAEEDQSERRGNGGGERAVLGRELDAVAADHEDAAAGTGVTHAVDAIAATHRAKRDVGHHNKPSATTNVVSCA